MSIRAGGDELRTSTGDQLARRAGRPRAPEPAFTVATKLRGHEYDSLIGLAQRERTTVAGLMRGLALALLRLDMRRR